MRLAEKKAALATLPPWAVTALLFLISAVLVAVGGYHLSRVTEQVSVKPVGNQTEETFRLVSRRVSQLEQLWQTAIQQDARRVLNDRSGRLDTDVLGIIQISRLTPAIYNPELAHKRIDTAPVTVRPVLEKYARHTPDEWVLPDATALTSSGWIEGTGGRIAWSEGNGRIAIIALVDIKSAATVALADIQARFTHLPLSTSEGAVIWAGPSGETWATSGHLTKSTPDETLRHVSLFGDWTLLRHYPVQTVESHRLPVLIGSLLISSLLIAAGVWSSIWLNRATRRAEQQVSFVNRVSHELRTPLTNLLLNTDLALDGLHEDDAKTRRRLQLIREETSRLSRIVDNVQTFSRLRRRDHLTPHSPTSDVDALARRVMENFAPLFSRKGIRIHYQSHIHHPLPVDGDAISQILSNLLSNVEKYAGENSTAEFTLTQSRDHLTVNIHDSGPGIPLGAEHRIFKPFERASSRVNEGATGTGLGLSISRDLAEQAGGRLILIPSEKGAHFLLEIPFTKTPAS